jgi:hypothetical protein
MSNRETPIAKETRLNALDEVLEGMGEKRNLTFSKKINGGTIGVAYFPKKETGSRWPQCNPTHINGIPRTGPIDDPFGDCPVCHGNPWNAPNNTILCTVCNGHKKDCPACKGTGTLEPVKVNITK